MNWSEKDLRQQTQLTIECVPGLAQEQVDRVVAEWSKGEYADNWHGHQEAQADLLKMLRWESMSKEQRLGETERQRKSIKWQAFK